MFSERRSDRTGGVPSAEDRLNPKEGSFPVRATSTEASGNLATGGIFPPHPPVEFLDAAAGDTTLHGPLRAQDVPQASTSWRPSTAASDRIQLATLRRTALVYGASSVLGAIASASLIVVHNNMARGVVALGATGVFVGLAVYFGVAAHRKSQSDNS